MKTRYFLFMALTATGLFFTSCADDNNSNPTLQQPTEFVMNEPAYSNLLVDLKDSETMRFSCTQPDFGFPAAVDYQIQVTLDPTTPFSVSYSEQMADETETLRCDYATVNATYRGSTFDALASLFNKAVMQCGQWAESGVPDMVEAYVRLKATVGSKSIYSNCVSLRVAPYYMVLRANPNCWFFIGEAVNTWTTGDIGNLTIPMSLKADESYNPETGYGVFEHTAYFQAGLFKIIEDPNAWAPMLGVSDEFNVSPTQSYEGTPAYRATDGDSDPACWNIQEPGYYTFTMDNSAGIAGTTISVKYAENQNPKTYTGISLSIDGAAAEMTENEVLPHIWYMDCTVGQNASGEFVAADGTVWRNKTFPIAIGTADGDPIAVKAGTYRVVFNDISGTYYFYAK